jgi:hypothetical protein
MRCASSIIKIFQVKNWKNDGSFIMYSYVVNKISNLDFFSVAANSNRSSLAPVNISIFNPGANLVKFHYHHFSLTNDLPR